MKKRLHNVCRARSPRRPLATGYWLLATGRPAFSLVEIVIALAVISIGLIAIVGLIPQGVQSAREAGDNTLAATIAHDTLNQIRQQVSVPGSTFPPTLSADTYYDATGTNQLSGVSADSYFDVNLTVQGTPNLMTVVARVSWPVKSANAIPLNTSTFFTTIANYQN